MVIKYVIKVKDLYLKEFFCGIPLTTYQLWEAQKLSMQDATKLLQEFQKKFPAAYIVKVGQYWEELS